MFKNKSMASKPCFLKRCIMNKKEYRAKAGQIIKTIEDKDEKSIEICYKLKPILEKYKKMALYAAMPTEANLDSLINHYCKRGFKVALPKIVEDEMLFFYIYGIDELQINNPKLPIREPVQIGLVKDPNEIDVMIIPGMLFDKNLNRLGHGKGYYDKYLKDYHGLKIGVCFDEQLLDEIPTDDLDIKMNMIITDKRTI